MDKFIIPDKSEFKLNEVTTLTAVKPYVLRYWESEFDHISPVTTDSGIKVYSRNDVEAIYNIKTLLFEHKLTIEKCRAEMDKITRGEPSVLSPEEEEEVIDPVVAQAVVESFDDSKAQKLILAKAKLNSILSQCKDIRNRYDWSPFN